MHELTLYYTSTCPFCLEVLRFLEKNNIQLLMKNIAAKSEFREELIALGGKGQVPCLMIDGQPLYESEDIIEWLKTNWSENDHT